MLKRFEQGVRSFHLSPLRTELFIADAVYCEWKHLPVQLCPHDSGPLPLPSLSFSISLSSLQKITHPRTSTCPSGPKATQSCTKNSSAHNMHTVFLLTHTHTHTLVWWHALSIIRSLLVLAPALLYNHRLYLGMCIIEALASQTGLEKEMYDFVKS